MSLPTEGDIELHLEFLKAVKALKVLVLSNPQYQESFHEKLWQLYVTNAVRNFIMFVSRLKIIHEEGEDYTKKIDELNIPLDILMVWHSFMLNPKSFYDNFKYNGFESFSKIPFPLLKISGISKDIDKEFKVFMISHFSEFDSRSIENFETLTYPVYCPHCKTTHGEKNMFIRSNSGFADQFFETISSCKCYSKLTHQVLRTFKLINDCKNPKSLPGSYKYLRSNITKSEVLLLKANESIKGFIFKNEKELREILIEEFLHKYKAEFNIPELLLLRDYVEANLIYLTIENALEIQEDLVACVIRQDTFIDQVLQNNWANNPDWFKSTTPSKISKITSSIKRYEEFFTLLKDPSHPVIPIVDIDLVWSTHLLNPEGYFKYSKDVTGTIISHKDKIEEVRLNSSFKKTAEIYEKKFGKIYSSCACDDCTNTEKKWGLFRTIFKQDTSQHMSQQNKIRVSKDAGSAPDDETVFKSRNYVVNPEEPANRYNLVHLDLYRNGEDLDCLDLGSIGTEVIDDQPTEPSSKSQMYLDYLNEVKASKEKAKAKISNESFKWAKNSPDLGFYFEPRPTKPRKSLILYDVNDPGNRILPRKFFDYRNSSNTYTEDSYSRTNAYSQTDDTSNNYQSTGYQSTGDSSSNNNSGSYDTNTSCGTSDF